MYNRVAVGVDGGWELVGHQIRRKRDEAVNRRHSGIAGITVALVPEGPWLALGLRLLSRHVLHVPPVFIEFLGLLTPKEKKNSRTVGYGMLQYLWTGVLNRPESYQSQVPSRVRL